jgi:outer membrane lipoprotein
LVLCLIALVVSGCATKPIAKEYRQRAAAEDVTFSMVLAHPDTYVGKVVLWGGIIIKTENLKKGTKIMVLETPLQRSERPGARDYSRGRFIARSAKLLDPEIYRPGKKITVAGVVSGKERRSLGETTYTYPVLSVRQLVLWQSYHPHYAYPRYRWAPYWGPSGEAYWDWGPGFGYYGDHDEGFEGEAHEHFRDEGAEHGERSGDQR